MDLHTLARTGDLSAARRLIAAGAPVDVRDPLEGRTPLMLAAESARSGVEMLELLIAHGADVNALERPPSVPFLDRLGGLSDSLKRMMGGAAPAPGDNGCSVLYFALRGGDPAKIALLLEAGADPHYRRQGGYDALIDAAVAARPETGEAITSLLLERGVAVDGISSYRESALSVAARTGRFGIVRRLLDAGADPEQLRWTPLMHAVVFGEPGTVRALLDRQPYAGHRERFLRTAFLLAAQAGRTDMAAVLLEAGGARPDERGPQGRTALMYAAGSDQVNMIDWLLERGAPVDETDDNGYTALLHACEWKARRAVDRLLRAGADPGIESKFGDKAIQLTDHPALLRRLQAAGSSGDEMTGEGRRALAGLPPARSPAVSRELYLAGRERRFGRRNPEVMDIPFWREMVRSGAEAGAVRLQYREQGRGGGPVWCYHRLGKTFTGLPDGRFIETGGEHEDAYDPDFCIYNEVVVFDGRGGFTIYGYPRDVFPPTDFHTATLSGLYLYLIGGLGYREERAYGTTPVYRLDTRSLAIERIATSGRPPGWIHKHRAVLLPDDKIRITDGKVCEAAGVRENESAFTLDLRMMQWEREG